jgi:transcriptional regulator with XRE-family HTH domain
MKMSKKLGAFFEQSKNTDSYWVEEAKLHFSTSLEAQRRASNMTYKAIAQKIGTSAAYITKIFRGDSNLTIETMVKLARSTGGRLEVHVVDASSKSVDWSLASLKFEPMVRPSLTHTSVTDFYTKSANNEQYAWSQGA